MALFDDDLPRPGTPAPGIGGDLSELSVEELREHLARLQGEIVRVEQEISSKMSVLDAADSFFKS